MRRGRLHCDVEPPGADERPMDVAHRVDLSRLGRAAAMLALLPDDRVHEHVEVVHQTFRM